MPLLIRIAAIACLIFSTTSVWNCQAAEYRLGSIVLRKAIPEYLRAAYICRSRTEFAETNECTSNKRPEKTSLVDPEVLTEATNGSVLYAYGATYETGDVKVVEKRAVSDVSALLDGIAPKRFTIDDAAVAAWGEVRLEKISSGADEYADIEGPLEQQYGLLMSTAESFAAAKTDRRPVYRIIGGDGALVIISKSKNGRPFAQRIIVAGAALAEKNFKSEIRKFLSEDQANAATDLSKWADVAYVIRRLALNTTPANANRVVDEVYNSTKNQKYRSHVWAYLPTSVITHLKKDTYRAVDIFTENSEFPAITKGLTDQLKLNPAEPFSEFLLYALGRFDDALRVSPNSPIKTTLTYASGHAHLRNCLSSIFLELAKGDDRSLLVDGIRAKSYVDDIDEENFATQYDAKTLKAKNINYQKIKKQIKDYDRKLQAEFAQRTANEANNRLRQQSFFSGHAYEHLSNSNDEYRDGEPSLSQYVSYFNQFPERYNSRPIIQMIPSFGTRCDSAFSLLSEVMKDPGSPHFDDAAYLLGWMDYHRGNISEALSRFEISMVPPETDVAPPISTNAANIEAKPGTDSKTESGDASDKAMADTDETDDYSNGVDFRDYSGAASHQIARILRTLTPNDALKRIEISENLSSNLYFWYEGLSSLYHDHQYQSVISNARVALKVAGIAAESLPVTTDPKRIEDALENLNQTNVGGLSQIIYLYQAAFEAQQLETILVNINSQSATSIDTKIKTLVIKYAQIKDGEEDKPSSLGAKALHRDLRQASYLAQRSLELVPRRGEFTKLREWLHYKRITILSQFDPVKVASANVEFQAEFPNSSLLDDTAAEQLFAEAVVMRDMTKASVTFDMIREQFPKANAIDNAYSWMAIGWTCAGQPGKAREIDQEIVRRFAWTRHARFARERLRKPGACSELLALFDWDYRAMTWRERNRIDTIQADLKNPHR